MLNFIKIEGNSGISDNGDGTYTVHFPALPSRLVGAVELFAAVKLKKITELKIATKAAIEAGFVSSVLGVPHTYDSALPQDQINLLGAKLKGVDLPFSCTDAQGIKASRLHTAAQINQVFLDGANWIESNKSKFWAKMALVNAATTIAEVNAVVF